MKDSFYLITLGSPSLLRNTEVVRLARKKSLILLTYLAMSRRWYGRDKLAALFWPDSEPEKARVALRGALSDLNKVLGKGWFEQSADIIKLADTFPLSVDLFHLHSQLKKLDEISPAVLEQSMKTFLDRVTFEESDSLDEWLRFRRATVRNDLIELLEAHLSQQTSVGNAEKLLQLACALQEIDPLNEVAVDFLLQSALEQGKRIKGLQVFDHYATRLASEMDLSPSPRLLELRIKLEQSEEIRKTDKGVADNSTLLNGDIDFINNEGTYIAAKYLDAGHPITMVLVFGFVSHIERLLEESRLRQFLLNITRYCNLVLFDKRGVGLSDRIGQPPTLQETEADILAIINHYQLKKVLLAGASEGGLSAIHCAAQTNYSKYLHGLLLYGTAAKWVADEDYQYVISADLYDKWLVNLEQNWGKPVNLQHFAPGTENDTALALWWAKAVRTASSPSMIRRILLAAKHADVREKLSQIQIPTLVMHKQGDRMLRIENGLYLARHIKDAKFAELKGDKHWLWLDDTSQYFSELSNFISRLEEKAA